MAGPTSKTHLSHSILNVNFDERGLRPSRISLRFLQYHSVQARSTMLIKMQHFFETEWLRLAEVRMLSFRVRLEKTDNLARIWLAVSWSTRTALD